MAPKKDFSKVNTNRVFNTIAEATAPTEEQLPGQMQIDIEGNITEEPAAGAKKKYKDRKTYTEEEAAAAMLAGKTAGKKGMKLPRINLAFTPDIYEYIQTMSRVRGENLTDFVNHILRQSMENNADLYEKAKEFKDSL